MRRPASILAQAFALVFLSVAATLGLGFGVLALSPPPPPPTVNIAAYVHAYNNSDTRGVERSRSNVPPASWGRPKSQAEQLISASLAGGIDMQASAISITMTVPTALGLQPRDRKIHQGQLTIIDVPAALGVKANGAPLDLGRLLRTNGVGVPPFVAAIRQADGSFIILAPKEAFPTAWQSRLLVIFGLSLAVVSPFAWFGAQRWTRAVRDLAARVNAFDGETLVASKTGAGIALEVRSLETAFAALHCRIRAQIEERQQMLMAVAHDLRTPLTSMRIRSEALAEPQRSGFVRDVGRLEKMISSVLDYARAQSAPAHRDIVDLGRLVGDMTADAIARGQNVTVSIEPVLVKGSAVDLSRVIDNLLSNAARYATSARVSVAVADGYARLTVVDDGPGVPDALLPRLSEAFFRVEASRSSATGGTGLGLATVKAIVLSHGGTLRLENVADGFKVEVTLPMEAA